MEISVTEDLIEKLINLKQDYINNSYIADKVIYDKDSIYRKNFSDAYDYWLKLLTNKYYKKLKEEDFLNLHKELMKNIDNDNAGIYRTVCAVFSGSRRLMPVPQKLPYIIGDIFYDIENHDEQNIIDFAIDIHFRIIDAYPFVEKNRDMARFVLNHILLSSGITKTLLMFNEDNSVVIYKEIDNDQDLVKRKLELLSMIGVK